MKTLITILGFTMLLTAKSPGQSVADSAGRQERQRQGFVDQNGDGINDRAQKRNKRMQRRKDRFIDANGDGICDNRESGLGFRRGAGSSQKESGKLSGKKGRGGKQ